MARIRTIKPSFFRHEELIDLEISHCDHKVMLVFSALWGNCDRNGVFEWKPRYLQLDILPFYWEATGKRLVDTLMLLREKGFVLTLTDGKKVYGYIPTFVEHQRLSGKEAKESATFPQPEDMTRYFFDEEKAGSNGEAPGKQQGKQEGNGVEEGNGGGNEKEKPATTKTESIFIKTFDSKEAALKELFPDHDYPIERATCIAHYRSQPPPIDPYCVIVKWFRRASKKAPIVNLQDHRQTDADLRAKGLIE